MRYVALLAVYLMLAWPALGEVRFQVMGGTHELTTPIEQSSPLLARKDDLVTGLLPVIEFPGLNPLYANPAVLTDGKTFDKVAMLADGHFASQTGTSATVTFALRKPSDVGAICVFSFWPDAHSLQDYDVEVSTDVSGAFRPLIRNVRVCKDDEEVAKRPAERQHFYVSVINDDHKVPIVRGVRQIRFIFWNAGEQLPSGVSVARDRVHAHWGSAISEIDVLSNPISLTDVDADAGQP